MKPLALTVLTLALAAPAAGQEASSSPATVQAEVHGLILMNAFANDAAVNNSDVPQFVAAPAPGGRPPVERAPAPRCASPASPSLALVPEFAGGQLTGELDVDFFGGQQPSTGGRTFPLAPASSRLRGARRAAGSTLFVGQESPPIAEINPSSLASIGIPEFAGAGNLWLWIPQVRIGARVAEAGAVPARRWRWPRSRPPRATRRPPSSPSPTSPSAAAGRTCRAGFAPAGAPATSRAR